MCVFLMAKVGFSQTAITWETLEDVTYEDKYFEEVEANVYYPTFGESVVALDGQMVYITGFVLAIDPLENFYVLSRHPYSSCFFCGSGGPDSVIELEFRSPDAKYTMDQEVTIMGKLRLNADDIYKCNYILEDVTEYKGKR